MRFFVPRARLAIDTSRMGSGYDLAVTARGEPGVELRCQATAITWAFGEHFPRAAQLRGAVVKPRTARGKLSAPDGCIPRADFLPGVVQARPAALLARAVLSVESFVSTADVVKPAQQVFAAAFASCCSVYAALAAGLSFGVVPILPAAPQS